MPFEVKRFDWAQTVPAAPKRDDKSFIAVSFRSHRFCLPQPFCGIVNANGFKGRSPEGVSRTSRSKFEGLHRWWKKRRQLLQKLTTWRGENPFRNRPVRPVRFNFPNQPVNLAGQTFHAASGHDFNCIRGTLLSASEPASLGDRLFRKDAPRQTRSPLRGA